MPNTIQLGSRGPDVSLAQYELCRDQLLGGPSDVDGEFGPNTEGAVKNFQQGHGLAVDGIVGQQTWGVMLGEHPQPPTLGPGSDGAVVQSLQKALNEIPPSPNPPLSVDGKYGPLTEQAVKALQARSGASVDGVVGDQTWVIHDGAAGGELATLVGV